LLDGLAGQRNAEIDLLAIKAEAAAIGDHDDAVMEGIVRLGDTVIKAGRSGVELGRAFHAKGLVGALRMELLDEVIELGLLLEEVGAGGAGGLLLEGERHAFMTAVLLRMASLDALDADTQSQPPDGEPGEG